MARLWHTARHRSCGATKPQHGGCVTQAVYAPRTCVSSLNRSRSSAVRKGAAGGASDSRCSSTPPHMA